MKTNNQKLNKMTEKCPKIIFQRITDKQFYVKVTYIFGSTRWMVVLFIEKAYNVWPYVNTEISPRMNPRVYVFSARNIVFE